MSPPAPEPATRTDSTAPERGRTADRVGVVASVLCGIHCAVTPFLLLLLPTFGRVWSHPATHWGMALLVVPLAGLMMCGSYRRHGRKWIVAAGSLGIVFILSGAAAPYIEEPLPTAAATTRERVAVTENETVACEDCCKDSCCPSVQVNEEGGWDLHIPAASILTTLGGAFLIVTHIGNLRLCRCAACQPLE